MKDEVNKSPQQTIILLCDLNKIIRNAITSSIMNDYNEDHINSNY